MGLLTVGLTIACILVTFLVAFYRLWQSPLVLSINLSGLRDITVHWPNNPIRVELAQTHQVIPADVEVKPKEEPIPEDILDYIGQESEIHAQDARKRRIRALKLDTGNWDAAFRLLQREDNAIE